MTKQSVAFEYGPPFPLKPLELNALKWEGQNYWQEVALYLQAHGVQIEEGDEFYVLTFPAGTTEQRRFPTMESERFKLVLPDGSRVYTIYSPWNNRHFAVPVHSVRVEEAALEEFVKNRAPDTRPTFCQIREQHNITIAMLADTAFISKIRLEQIEEGQPAGEGEILRIVTALNTITKLKYKLLDFSGFVYKPQNPPAR